MIFSKKLLFAATILLSWTFQSSLAFSRTESRCCSDTSGLRQDSIKLILHRLSYWDTAVQTTDVQSAFKYEIASDHADLWEMSCKLKRIIFKLEDDHKHPSIMRLNRLHSKYPLSIATLVLYNKNPRVNKHQKRYRRIEFQLNQEIETILNSGNGTFDRPYKALDFYDSYYFIKYYFRLDSFKGGIIRTDDHRLLSAFNFYDARNDELIFVYFDITHLIEYMPEEVPVYLE